MRNKFIYIIILIVSISVLFAVLYHTGYLVVDQTIITPGAEIEWKNFDDTIAINQSNASDNSTMDFLLLSNITNIFKNIPGIENINYQIFTSNESIKRIIDNYKKLLEGQGYTYHEEYSNVISYDFSEIYYYSFIKGLNGVIIFLTTYEKQTWFCYTTGHITQYQAINKYINSHDIL